LIFDRYFQQKFTWYGSGFSGHDVVYCLTYHFEIISQNISVERNKEMKKKIVAAVLAAVMVFSLTACQGNPLAKDEIIPSDESTSDSFEMPPKENVLSSEPAEGELDAETAQLLYNNYIDINNYMVGRLYESLERYFNYVDIESEEFKLLDEEDNYYDCYSISDSKIEDLEETYEIVNGKSEKDALDQAFLDLYPSIKSLMLTLNEIYDYTDMETYKVDDFAKSQEHHAALMSALNEYTLAEEAFRNELNTLADQRQAEELEQLKAEGYEVIYSLIMTINLAQELESELYRQEVWDDNILDMDMTTIKPLYDEFASYVDTVLAYSEDSEALSKEGLNSGSLALYVMHMKDALKSINRVLAKVEAGEALDSSDLISTMPGQCSLSAFADGVSDMIDAYNNIYFY